MYLSPFPVQTGEDEANRIAPDGTTHGMIGKGANNVVGGDADALTHCIAACTLASAPYPCWGPDQAYDILQSRETAKNIDTQLDFLNNESGMGIGMSLKPGQDCSAACLAALKKGILNEIDPTGKIVKSS